MSRIRRKIENLQGQPEHVRSRAATLFALGVVGAAALVWLFVFLPVQLWTGSRSGDEELPEKKLVDQIRSAGNPLDQVQPLNQGQVGGVQDVAPTNTGNPSAVITPNPALFITDSQPAASPSAAPESEASIPVATLPPTEASVEATPTPTPNNL